MVRMRLLLVMMGLVTMVFVIMMMIVVMVLENLDHFLCAGHNLGSRRFLVGQHESMPNVTKGF